MKVYSLVLIVLIVLFPFTESKAEDDSIFKQDKDWARGVVSVDQGSNVAGGIRPKEKEDSESLDFYDEQNSVEMQTIITDNNRKFEDLQGKLEEKYNENSGRPNKPLSPGASRRGRF